MIFWSHFSWLNDCMRSCQMHLQINAANFKCQVTLLAEAPWHFQYCKRPAKTELNFKFHQQQRKRKWKWPEWEIAWSKEAKGGELTRGGAGAAGLKLERSGPDWAAGSFNTTHRDRETVGKMHAASANNKQCVKCLFSLFCG